MTHSDHSDPSDPLGWLLDLDGVPSGFAATRDGIDTLLRDRGLRRTSPGQTAESLLRGATASASLEGAKVSLEEVRAGSDDPAAAAAVRLNTELLALVPVLARAPLQALSRMHVLVSSGGVGSEVAADAGKPVSAEAAARMSALGELLGRRSGRPGQPGQAGRTGRTGETPALLLAAVAHAEVATVAPFSSYNGLVARALERLVLVARGVDPASLVVPEAGHAAQPEAYASNLRGYASGERSGLHSWLLYAGEAQARGAEASPLSD